MAIAGAGLVGCGSSSWIQSGCVGKTKRRVCRSSSVVSASLTEQYRTLRIQPGASELEVKKAFRKLALQYHPDVCKGSNCGVQFHRINEAYDIVMSNLRGEADSADGYVSSYEYDNVEEPMRGMCDSDWDQWEEWMGWEGAGIRDYSSHINPYI
ncbi:PREDICTED: chaperone protein dnaJ 8, chloroplastic-like [Nelumbo nucifera]|uniref:Chaperone protein dnaJ 8, chloroplastic-like n=1 Tax=Nelumbo nucifera TaxID=4432 RepID=A0A1U8AEV8_NELNU|nr:PREDICTED: chaperone protein dnaJ 8, chloroplastic-like [Nelumbo nucifera]